MTMLDIFLRNFINSAVPGIVDLTQLSIMWCAFLSIPIGFVRNDHVSVDLLSNHLPARVQRWLALIIALLASSFLAGAAVWSGDQLLMAHQQSDKSSTIGVPMMLYWVPVVFGFSLSALCAVTHGLQWTLEKKSVVPELEGRRA
jgi:TRAP-type C4-dicarboxylate transport system permease small subunit